MGPYGIVVDTANNIYTSNLLSDNITKITPEGISTIFGNTVDSPYGITIDTTNNIYIVSYYTGEVSKITPDGVTTIIGSTGSNPIGLTIDSLGNLYTNANQTDIYKINPLEKTFNLIGKTDGDSYHIITDLTGNVYTTNYFSNNVTKFIKTNTQTGVKAANTNMYNSASTSIDNTVTYVSNCPAEQVIIGNANIFSTIKVSAEIGPTLPTISASACGVIYTPLEVTINQATNQIDPTTTGPVKFTIVFNQPIDVTTFTAEDIKLTGTAPGLSVVSITQIAPIDGTTFEVLVMATGNGTVIANVPTKTLTNSIQAINPDTPVFNESNSTSTDNVITIINSVQTPMAVTISVPAISNNPKPIIVGTCDSGAVLNITITTGVNNISNQTLPSLTCGLGRSYSTNPLSNIPDGPYCATVVSTDTANNTATAQSCGIIDTSTIVTVLVPAITNNTRPTLTGTCEAGASLTITITTGITNSISETLPTFVCESTNLYSKIPTIDIPQGSYCVQADARDPAGNTAMAKGCGNIFVTVSAPETTTDNKPEITGTCTPSVAGGYQVSVVVVIKIGNGFQTINETITTTCSTIGTYKVRPTIIIPVGAFQVTATATDAIGNQAIAVDAGAVVQAVVPPVNIPGATIIISQSSSILPSPTSNSILEVFDSIFDPYQCGQSITGKVNSNYGVKSVVVKLFTRRGDGSYESEPKYIFRPILDSQGRYTIPLDYNNEITFVKGLYRVEYASESSTKAIRSGSYLADITNQCSVIIPTVVVQNTEITPEGKVTIRTGGNNELYYIAIMIAIVFSGVGYWKLRRKTVKAVDVFGK